MIDCKKTDSINFRLTSFRFVMNYVLYFQDDFNIHRDTTSNFALYNSVFKFLFDYLCRSRFIRACSSAVSHNLIRNLPPFPRGQPL